MRFVLMTLALALSSTALAIPTSLSHQGRLFGTSGTPLDGAHDLVVNLYDTPSGGTAFWTGTYTAEDFDAGYYSVVMDSIESDDLDTDGVWMGITVDGGAELSTRIQLLAVPYAVHATHADHSDTATTATNATTADSALTVTGSLPAHTHDGDDITGGGVPLGQLPTGTTVDSVALGQHTHSATELVSDSIDPNRLTFGGGLTEIARGNHTHTTIRLDDDSTTACNSSALGMLRLNGNVFEGCGPEGWIELGRTPSLGDPTKPGVDCKDILADDSTAASGVFWIDPDGIGGEDALQTYCDMNTDGGGWTLAGFSYMSGNNSTPTNMPTLKCGGGTFTPTDRGVGSGAINAIALAQGSTEMGLSLNRSGATVVDGGMGAYEYGYKMVIPDPSIVTFDNHAAQSPTWGQSSCTATSLTAIVGESGSWTRYTKAHGLGVSWTDSYPTGYGAGDTTNCTQTYNSGAMIHSVHSGSHRGTSSGTVTSECDLSNGSWTYDHRDNMTNSGTGATGSAAIWFR